MIERYPPHRLRSLRQRALLSQRDVERLTGISDATIAYLESGRHRPQSETLRRLLFLYSINISTLERQEQLWGCQKIRSKRHRQSGHTKSPARRA